MSKHRCQSKPHKVHLLSSHLPQLKPQWLLAACRIKCKLLPCHSLPTHYIVQNHLARVMPFSLFIYPVF